MQELVDKSKEVLSPLIQAINRHDKLNKLSYGIGGSSVVSAIQTGEVKDATFDIYLSNLETYNYFYDILSNIGYIQYEKNDWFINFRSYNNYINVYYMRSFTPLEYIHNADVTISSVIIDNNLTFYCRPEFFKDLKSETINIVNLNEPDPNIERRLETLKKKGFKLNKKSEKIFNTFTRGLSYKNLLIPIKDEAVLIFN